jgi:uridine kinase
MMMKKVCLSILSLSVSHVCGITVSPKNVKITSADDDFHKRQKQYHMSNDDTVNTESKVANELNSSIDEMKNYKDKNSVDNKLVYDDSKFDSTTNEWSRKPSDQKAYKEYKRTLCV